MTTAIHILLVEDNAADVDLTRDALASTQYEVKLSVAKDGVEAIDFLRGALEVSSPGQPMLILLDLNLPRKDGRQLLAMLKSEDAFRRIPATILSASELESDVTSCYNLGANRYIVKPDNLQDYRSVVRKQLEFWLGVVKLPRHEGHSAGTQIGYAH